jgi:hypothetical protein
MFGCVVPKEEVEEVLETAEATTEETVITEE